MPPRYKLIYFDKKVRGEVARLLFALAGVEYEDVRIGFRSEEWERTKSNYPNSQLPVLEIDGQPFCQSYATQRYLARQFGLAGKSEEDELKADMIVDMFEDLIKACLESYFMKDPDKKIKWARKYEKEKLPTIMQNFEKVLIENQGGDGFFVGDEITWVELHFINAIDWLDYFGVTIDWSKYAKLAPLREKVLKIPRIADWIEKRPATQF